MAKMVENIVTETCYMNDRIYREGEKVMLPEGVTGRAFHPIGATPPPKKSFDAMLSERMNKDAQAEAAKKDK